MNISIAELTKIVTSQAKRDPVDEKPCLDKGIDAMNWAKEFIETFSDPLSKEIQHWKIDENLMHSWFANAIMTGYDFAKRQMKNKENSVTDSSSIIEPINTGQLPHYNPLAHQEGGDHYKKFPIQPIEFCQRNKLGACESSVIKYVCRYKEKGGASDIRKAIHYLQIMLETEYANQGTDRES